MGRSKLGWGGSEGLPSQRQHFLQCTGFWEGKDFFTGFLPPFRWVGRDGRDEKGSPALYVDVCGVLGDTGGLPFKLGQ